MTTFPVCKWQPFLSALSMICCTSPKSSPEETCINTQLLHRWHCSVAVHEVLFPWITSAGQRWSSVGYSQAQILFSLHTSNSAWKELRPISVSSCLTYESWGLEEHQRDRFCPVISTRINLSHRNITYIQQWSNNTIGQIYGIQLDIEMVTWSSFMGTAPFLHTFQMTEFYMIIYDARAIAHLRLPKKHRRHKCLYHTGILLSYDTDQHHNITLLAL